MGKRESDDLGRGNRISDDQRQTIMDRFDYYRRQGLALMHAYERVGLEVGRSTHVIGVVVNRMRPTTGAARSYLRSKALRLAKRLVAKANTTEILDILSRPSMGVLDPPVREGHGGMGFQLLVSADSCGAVKVGLQTTNNAPDQAREAFDPYALQPGEIDGVQSPRQALGPRVTTWGRSKNVQEALENARIRLANARHRGRAQNAGVQVVDGELEEEGSAGDE